MKADELKPCPFCGGEVKEHPNKEYKDDYYACYHKPDCFLLDNYNGTLEPELHFTLIPKNKEVGQWNNRQYTVDKCKEQREICYNAYMNGGMQLLILNAPEPE